MALFSGWSPFPYEMRDASGAPMGTGRPEGLHLGDVIRRVAVAMGDKYGDTDLDVDLCAQEGFLWETAVEYMHGGLPFDPAMDLAFKRYMVGLRTGVAKQAQVERDGIHMTPDGLNPTLGEIESYKSTRRSLRRALTQTDFEEHFWKWHMAEKGYALALGVDTCRFVVLWHGGDYSKGKGSGPQVLQATVTWTPEELVENWRLVMKYKGAK